MRSRRPALSLMLGALALSPLGGCALFGLGELRCESDSNCPSGMHCVESFCAQDLIDAGVSTSLDAAGVDGRPREAGALDRRGEGSPLVIDCAQPPCSMSPDSPTLRCAASGGAVSTSCPAEGEALFGQDGNFLIHALSFELEAAGVLLERVSGLRWERDAATGLTWEGAYARCGELGLAGHLWRLPQHHELFSLVDFGRTDPAIDSRFTHPDEWFWSASGYGGYYWGVHFGRGVSTGIQDSMGTGAARCVSGDTLEVDSGTFQFPPDRWRDTRTGLEWQPTIISDQDWSAALASCQTLELAALDDWRLPSVKELETLVQRRSGEIMTYNALVPDTDPGSYWSSTPCADSSGIWSINFVDGLDSCRQDGALAHVRCVRGPGT